MGDNLKIRKLRADVTDVFNLSTLPVEVKRMIAKEILAELTRLAEEYVEKEKNEFIAEQNAKEKENVLRTATEATEHKLKEEAMESKEGEENGIQ